jgi:ubiquinone/menaquinone biosynthesis C-methylase UbiE/DNA-binding transcriptional ArsR family regulator
MTFSSKTSVLDRLSVLADPTRSRILLLLDRHELTVGELCTIVQLPQSTVSRHLKTLADDGWVIARGEGTTRFYKMVVGRLDPATQDLWLLVRAQVAQSPSASQDLHRATSVLQRRVVKARAFFQDSVEFWDRIREEMIGRRADLLALLDLLDDDWTVGDLGCGAGQLAEALAPCVAHVIGVDESGPMLSAAAKRLANYENVELRSGTLESLPIEDESLDAAIVFLVAHFISDPAKAIAEIRRVLTPGGKLLIVDLMSHDRMDYVVQLGHVWQGFDGEQVKEWLTEAGFASARYRALPADPDAKGPALFAASARKA